MNAFKFILLLVVLIPTSPTQTPSPTQIEEMRKLDFLVGEWKGEGWELTKDGEPANTFSQTTKVKAKEGNAKLRVQDSRSYKPRKGVLHSSTLDATISYDEATKLYHWQGQHSKSVLEAKLVSERTVQYGMPFSVRLQPEEGYRKTTIRVTHSGQWEETLEVWSKGQWYKVEQSVLTRVK